MSVRNVSDTERRQESRAVESEWNRGVDGWEETQPEAESASLFLFHWLTREAQTAGERSAQPGRNHLI